jgi:two-component system, OmpR family, response regulator
VIEFAEEVRNRPVRTILVVDDSRTNLSVIGRRLTHMGYLTALTDNGVEALDLLTARGFDLVLLDIVMPNMSGLQVLAEIRSRQETHDLPVIVVTARSDPASAVQALAAGADDHVPKPFHFDVLAARMERLLTRGKRIADLKRSNAALDARIAARAMELGEARAELSEMRADRMRLVASLEALNDEVSRLRS